MAYEEQLAKRVRQALTRRSAFEERAMFGGLAFMVRGHMCCGLAKGRLMVRVNPDDYDQLLGEAGAQPMDFTGRPLRGFLYVSGVGIATPSALDTWLARALDFAETRPIKVRSKTRAKSKKRPNTALQPTSRGKRKTKSRPRSRAARG
ncbi:MAG TPA: TfoX/Sxy family protein [Vicinamibacterales bacterium]|nr:TfoX/Sxy family protein [Vicinamibacterales bacterium]